MNRKWFYIFIIFAVFIVPQRAHGDTDPEYVDGEILVEYKKGLSERSKGMIARQVETDRVKKFEDFEIELVELPLDMSVEEGVKKYKFYPKIEVAEPNYYIRLSATTPDDTNFSDLWGLNNTGQAVNGTSGISDSDMDAPEAWDTTTGSAGVVVALLDSGIDLDHEDLSGNLWTNSGETAGNGTDDDGNGYVDDVDGWDFVNDDNDPNDDNDHGSNMAGIIGAVGDNNKGVCGVSWTVKIMPIKILNVAGTGTVADAISAVNYAADKNVKVMNASWSATSSSAALKSAIEDSGALFVAAAGNDGDGNEAQGWDIDTAGQEIYPAAEDSSNILAIAAIDQDDALADFSNFGATSVDVASPGKNIYSCDSADSYEFVSGTSAATAYASGLAGLVLAAKSTLTIAQLKDQIANSVDTKLGLNNKVVTGGRINAHGAVTTPSAPSSLSVTAASSTQNNLSWTDNSSNEFGFKIERKSGSGSYSQIATPAKNATSYSDTGLSASTSYTYKIRAYNNIGNSAYSGEDTAITSAANNGGNGGGGSGGGGGGGGGCFIATASFGSPLAEEVRVLCNFRDTYMLNSALGQGLVKWYYRVSPCIARHIEHDKYLKGILRSIVRFIIKHFSLTNW